MERSENALAAEVFDQLCSAGTLKSILNYHRQLCDLLHIRPTHINQFYPKLKAKLRSWRAQALWNKFDKRASHKCYNRGKACSNIRLLVIGGGPCGLRTAIEAQLLGAKVVVIEKRDRITRNNVLHLWPFVITDLKALGAKKFFGRFCAGAIDHISIRQLQCILLKVALILGVEIHEGVGFESVIPPPDDQADERVGWRACTSPPDHPVSQYEFNALIGADGKRNTLDGFKRKEFRGKLAIAITANFINRHTEAEARVEEISGVAFIFNQKFFKELYASTGIDLENIVYYKDDTHYFVMTAKKHSLIDKGVIISDYSDTAKLLSPENVDKTALMEYAREAADFSTGCRLPQLEFAVNHYGQPDVAMFDFTSMYAAENASRFIERRGHRLYVTLVGDSLLEPFWPTGSGCARGFLSSMDSCWALRSWGLGAHPLEVVAERESIYRLLAQTTPENLHRDLQAYTLDPCTRYPNLNSRSVLPIQMKAQFDTDDSNEVDQFLKAPKNTAAPNNDPPKKRKRREAVVHADTLLHWLQRQVALCDEVSIENVTSSFKDGMALCAILNRYRPHLLDFASLDREDVAKNNQLAFDILEKELAIPPVMTGEEMAECDVPDKLAMLSYLSQVYEAFRGEIPHIKHPKMEETEEGKDEAVKSQLTRIRTLAQMSPQQKLSLLGKLANRPSRKRRSHLNSDRINRSSMDGKGGGNGEEFSGRVKDIEDKLRGTHTDKKPKDLLRAIGKIEKTDWNVKQIEQKIEENRMGRGSSKRSEKVPKWSKQQFEDKFTAVERKLRARSNKADDNKYSDIDITMKKIDKKVKEGFSLEQGKVSAMAEHLAKIHRQPEPAVTPTGKQAAVMMPSQGASELCHFCNKRVYLMERLSAEGRFFHRGCFRCQYCSTSLRLGNYAFDREGKYGHKFFCVQHFGLQGATANRRREEVKPMVTTLPKTPTPSKTSTLQPEEMVDMGSTPERVEFENSTCLEDEVEEDEFTDRNFGLSTTDVSETEGSDSSSESDGFAEAEDGGLDPDLETLRLAKDWTRRYASSYSSDSQDESDTEMEDEEEDERKKKNQDGSDSGSETEGAKGTIRRSHRAQRQRKIHNMAASHSETIRNRHPPSQSFSICKQIKTNRNKGWARSGLDDGSPTGVSKIQKLKVAPSSSSSLKTNESRQHKTHSEKRFEHSPLGAKPVDDAARSVPKEVPSESVRLPYSLDSKKPMSPSFDNTNALSTASGLIEMNANNSSPSIATATQVVQKTIFSVVQPFQSAVGFISKIAEKAVCTVTPSLQKAEVNVVVPAGVHTRPNETVLKERNVNDSPEGGLYGNRNSLDSKFNCNPAVPDLPSKTLVLKSGDSDGKVAVRDQPSLKSPSLVSESVRSDQERKIKNVNDEENTFSHHTENFSALHSNVQQYPTKHGSGKNSKDKVRSAQRPLQVYRELLDQYSPHKYYDAIVSARGLHSSATVSVIGNDNTEGNVKHNQHSVETTDYEAKSVEYDKVSNRTNQDSTQTLKLDSSPQETVPSSILAAPCVEPDLKTVVHDTSTQLTLPSAPEAVMTNPREISYRKNSISRIPVRDSINISRRQFFSQQFDGTKFSLVQEPNLNEVSQSCTPSHEQSAEGSYTNTSLSGSSYVSNICAPSSQCSTVFSSLIPNEPNDEKERISVLNSTNTSSLENSEGVTTQATLRPSVFKSRFLKSSSSLSSPINDSGAQMGIASTNADSILPPSEIALSPNVPSASNLTSTFKSRFLKSSSSVAGSPDSETDKTTDLSIGEKPLSNSSMPLSSRPAPFKSRFLKSSSSFDSTPSDVNTKARLDSKIPILSDNAASTLGTASSTDVTSSKPISLTSRTISSLASTVVDKEYIQHQIGDSSHHNLSDKFSVTKESQKCSSVQTEQEFFALPSAPLVQQSLQIILPSSQCVSNESVVDDPLTNCSDREPPCTMRQTKSSTKLQVLYDNNKAANNIVSVEKIPPESKATESTAAVPPFRIENISENPPDSGCGTLEKHAVSVITASALLPETVDQLPTKCDEGNATSQHPVPQTIKTKGLEINYNTATNVHAVKTTDVARIPYDEHGQTQDPRNVLQCSSPVEKSMCVEETGHQNIPDSSVNTQSFDAPNSNTKEVLVQSNLPIKPIENISKSDVSSTGGSIIVKFPKAAMFRVCDKPKDVLASSSKQLHVSSGDPVSSVKPKETLTVEPVITSSTRNPNSTCSKSVENQSNSFLPPAALRSTNLANLSHRCNNFDERNSEAPSARVLQPSTTDTSLMTNRTSDPSTRPVAHLISNSDSANQSVPASSSVTVQIPKSAIFRTQFKTPELSDSHNEYHSNSSDVNSPTFPSVAMSKLSPHVLEQPTGKHASQSSAVPLNLASEPRSSDECKSHPGADKTGSSVSKIASPTNSNNSKYQSVPSSSSIIVKLPKSAIFRTPLKVPEQTNLGNRNISCSSSVNDPSLPSVTESVTVKKVQPCQSSAVPPSLLSTSPISEKAAKIYGSKDEYVPSSSSVIVKLPKSAVFRTPLEVREQCSTDIPSSSSLNNPTFSGVPKNAIQDKEPRKEVNACQLSLPSNHSSKTCYAEDLALRGTSQKDSRTNSEISEKGSESSTYLPSISSDVKVTVSADAPSNRTITVVMKVPKRKIQQLKSQLTPNSNTTEPHTQSRTS